MNGVEAFTPQQVQENLGRMNGTEQYSFLDTPENREKAGEQKIDKKLEQQVAYLSNEIQKQKIKNEAQDKVDEKYGEQLNVHANLLKDVHQREGEFTTVLEGFTYNSQTWMFNPTTLNKEPWSRIFWGREGFVAEQQWAHLDTAVEQIN